MHSWLKKDHAEFVATGLIAVCFGLHVSVLHSGDWLYVTRFIKLSTCYYITVFSGRKAAPK